MKKILTSILLLVCFMFCLTACSKPLNEKYWLDTSASLTTYFSSESYKSIKNIVFNININTIMGEDYGNEFLELKNVYSKLFNSSSFTAEKYATVLTVTPLNANDTFKNKIIDVNNKLEELKNSLQIFINKKADFEARIDFTDEESVKSSIEKSRLVKFKMDYLNVIESAYKLSNSLYNAYTTGYYTFSDFNNISATNFTADQININRELAINGSNLELVKSAINVLKMYNAKEIYYDYNNYWQVSQKFFTDVVEYVYNPNNQLPSHPSLLPKFVVWQGVYDEFLLDSQRFENIVKNLQLDKLQKCNNDTFAYSIQTGNPLDQSNANFFLNYYKNVNILYEYTKALV